MSAAHGHRGGGKSKGGANPGGKGHWPPPPPKKKKNKKKGMKENRIHDLNTQKNQNWGRKGGGGCMGE